jgi:hypothetical protein
MRTSRSQPFIVSPDARFLACDDLSLVLQMRTVIARFADVLASIEAVGPAAAAKAAATIAAAADTTSPTSVASAGAGAGA